MTTWVGGLGSAISVGIQILGTVASIFEKKPTAANAPTELGVLYSKLSQQMTSISVQINTMRNDIISRLDFLDTSASFRDINQDLIVLQAMINTFSTTQNLTSL